MSDDQQLGTGRECQLCPICALVRAVGGTQPEVVEHLSSAAREFALALRATLDAHLDGHAPPAGRRPGSERLERIRID